MRAEDCIVVGGGITGLAAAHALAGHGLRVALLERATIGAMASGRTLGGVRQSGRDPAELPLAGAAVARWASLADELGADTGYRRSGNLRLARDEAEARMLQHMVAQQRALGLEIDFLANRSDVRAIAPALGDVIVAASYCPSDGHADPARTLAAYRQALHRKGVTIAEGTEVVGLLRRGERVCGVRLRSGERAAGAVVLATGVNTAALLGTVGLDLPLTPKLVTVLQTAPMPPILVQVFGVARADCAGRQEIDGRLRVTTGIGDWLHPPDRADEEVLMPPAGELGGLIERAGAVLPALLAAPVARVWGGLVDLTPDGLPVLDRPIEGLVVAAGFSGHGWCLGPVSGQIAADLVLGRSPDFDLGPFRLARLGGGARGAVALSLHG